MSDEVSLSLLRDIHLPPPIIISSPFWTLILFSILFIFFLGYFLVKRWKKNGIKREALTFLKTYEMRFSKDKNAQKAAEEVSLLLRRVALSYAPRSEVAGLAGDAWLHFLGRETNAKMVEQLSYHLLVLPYDIHTKVSDLSPLFKFAKIFISTRRRR